MRPAPPAPLIATRSFAPVQEGFLAGSGKRTTKEIKRLKINLVNKTLN